METFRFNQRSPPHPKFTRRKFHEEMENYTFNIAKFLNQRSENRQLVTSLSYI